MSEREMREMGLILQFMIRWGWRVRYDMSNDEIILTNKFGNRHIIHVEAWKFGALLSGGYIRRTLIFNGYGYYAAATPQKKVV